MPSGSKIAMDLSEGLAALQLELDQEQQELLALVEETQFAWEQKLRLSFARLRVLAKPESSESLPSGSESKDAFWPRQTKQAPDALSRLHVGQATTQPQASEVDPLPVIAHELLEVLDNSPQGSFLTASPKSAVPPPPAAQWESPCSGHVGCGFPNNRKIRRERHSLDAHES